MSFVALKARHKRGRTYLRKEHQDNGSGVKNHEMDSIECHLSTEGTKELQSLQKPS